MYLLQDAHQLIFSQLIKQLFLQSLHQVFTFEQYFDVSIHRKQTKCSAENSSVYGMYGINKAGKKKAAGYPTPD